MICPAKSAIKMTLENQDSLKREYMNITKLLILKKIIGCILRNINSLWVI